MTNIPSVEERVKEITKAFSAAYELGAQEARTALLTELRNSGLLEEITPLTGGQDRNKEADGHNDLARAIKAYINNLINPTSV